MSETFGKSYLSSDKLSIFFATLVISETHNLSRHFDDVFFGLDSKSLLDDQPMSWGPWCQIGSWESTYTRSARKMVGE